MIRRNTTTAPTRSVEVMFFLPQLGGGGAEMNAVRLAGGLIAQGLRPTYVVTRGPGSYAVHLPPEVEVIVLPTGSINSSSLRLARSVRPLARLIDERRPAVLCPVMPAPSIAALESAKWAHHRPKVVLSIQNTLDPIRSGRHGLIKSVEKVVFKRYLPRADMVIALSRGVGADLVRHAPAMRDRVHVVHNVGLPLASQLSADEPQPPPEKNARFRFLACGRLVEQKGYPVLFDAFAKVAATEDVELHILGEGPLKDLLLARAAALGIASRVHFLGFRKNPFVHMAAADAFVLSSLWEGFGNVLVEAMSMGTPVVSTSCPHGPDEIINSDEDGLLVPPGDALALADAMLMICKDENLRSRLAAAGKRRASDFSVEAAGNSYASLFNRVTEGENR